MSRNYQSDGFLNDNDFEGAPYLEYDGVISTELHQRQAFAKLLTGTDVIINFEELENAYQQTMATSPFTHLRDSPAASDHNLDPQALVLNDRSSWPALPIGNSMDQINPEKPYCQASPLVDANFAFINIKNDPIVKRKNDYPLYEENPEFVKETFKKKKYNDESVTTDMTYETSNCSQKLERKDPINSTVMMWIEQKSTDSLGIMQDSSEKFQPAYNDSLDLTNLMQKIVQEYDFLNLGTNHNFSSIEKSKRFVESYPSPNSNTKNLYADSLHEDDSSENKNNWPTKRISVSQNYKALIAQVFVCAFKYEKELQDFLELKIEEIKEAKKSEEDQEFFNYYCELITAHNVVKFAEDNMHGKPKESQYKISNADGIYNLLYLKDQKKPVNNYYKKIIQQSLNQFFDSNNYPNWIKKYYHSKGKGKEENVQFLIRNGQEIQKVFQNPKNYKPRFK